MANSYNSRDGHSQSRGAYRTDGWDAEPRLSDMKSGHNVDYPAFLKTLEEIELEYRREADEMGRIRDKEEDEENHKHREVEFDFSITKVLLNIFCNISFFFGVKKIVFL